MVTQPPIFAFQDALLEFENSVKPVQRQNRKNQHWLINKHIQNKETSSKQIKDRPSEIWYKQRIAEGFNNWFLLNISLIT